MANGSLSSILDTLPPLMNALRMVWIISRHYSDDVRMGNLFERVANEVRQKGSGTGHLMKKQHRHVGCCPPALC
jgi:dynein heavy chain